MVKKSRKNSGALSPPDNDIGVEFMAMIKLFINGRSVLKLRNGEEVEAEWEYVKGMYTCQIEVPLDWVKARENGMFLIQKS